MLANSSEYRVVAVDSSALLVRQFEEKNFESKI